MVSPSSSASLSMADTDEESLRASSSNPASFSIQSILSSALSLEVKNTYMFSRIADFGKLYSF